MLDAEQLFREGAALAQQGRAADAMLRYRQVVAADPGHAGANNALGMARLAARDFHAATDHFRAAAERDPEAPILWINLATARRGLADDEGERGALLRALSVDQRNLTANLRLAELHERLGERAGAHVRWSAVLALASGMTERSRALEQVLARAQAYVADQAAAFGGAIDDGLSDLRAQVTPAMRRRFDASVDALLGRRRLYVNECHGFHFGFLPPDEFFDRSLSPWLEKLEAATPLVREECRRQLGGTRAHFAPYVSLEPGSPESKWSPLDNKDDWSALYLWRYGVRDDAACAACPETAALLERMPLNDMPGRGPTAFFSILKPGTRLPPHTGVSNARGIVHLPLIVPPGCGFRVGGETRPWREGEAFVFDDTIEHEAWNDSDEDRAVLIFDVWNPHLSEIERALLRRFFAVADASGLNPGATAVAE